jgi:peptidoglycan/LPS O-acetylase OafA/YrhL
MELGAGRLLQIAGAVAGVTALAWLLTKYVEEPSYRALAALRVRGLGARALAWLNT